MLFMGKLKERSRVITCDSLGDVTWSHGIHNVREICREGPIDLVRKPHHGSQNCIVMSVYVYEGVFTTGVSNK